MSVSPKHLRDWMALVAGFLSPAFPAEAMEALLRLERPLLRYNADSFTAASAEAVAGAKRFGPVPDLATVQATLSLYLRETRPFYTPLPSKKPEPWPEPDAAEVARVAALVRQMNEEIAAQHVEQRGKSLLRDVTLKGDALIDARARAAAKFAAVAE